MTRDIQRVEAPPRLPPRDPQGHKGTYGRVLIVGGSRGMVGAPALAANACLRGGAGLVTLALAEVIQLQAATLAPCATSVPLACNREGELAPEAIGQVAAEAGKADVLAVGPGMGQSGGARQLVRAALEMAPDTPVVLDADGLNNLAKIDDWPGLRRAPLLLTPHPGEFGRLTGLGVKDIQADREAKAIEAARRWRAGADAPLVLLLKGAGTIVTDGERLYVNRTGNPGMATAGAGDVLTGLAAALIGQGLDPFAAACLAAHLHGRAGDLAADRLGQVSLVATDLIDFLPAAFQAAI